LTGARRERFYLARAFYVVVQWSIHSIWTAAYEGSRPSSMVSWFGLSTLGAIAVGQEILVLALVPARVAGAIADEKRRTTLHNLPASQLTSPEIGWASCWPECST
jgi:hypothetical protein